MTEYNKRNLGTILVAEDEPIVLSVVKEFIKRGFPEFKIETFLDGNALEQRLKGDLDLVRAVITDHNMPGKNGGELIEKYALAPKFKDKIPMFLYYGDALEIGIEAINNGAYCFTRKPYCGDLMESLRAGLIDYGYLR